MVSEPTNPKQRAVLDEVRVVTEEIGRLTDATQDLKAYRVELCQKARDLGVTTRTLGAAAGVSGVAVTLWLQKSA